MNNDGMDYLDIDDLKGLFATNKRYLALLHQERIRSGESAKVLLEIQDKIEEMERIKNIISNNIDIVNKLPEKDDHKTYNIKSLELYRNLIEKSFDLQKKIGSYAIYNHSSFISIRIDEITSEYDDFRDKFNKNVILVTTMMVVTLYEAANFYSLKYFVMVQCLLIIFTMIIMLNNSLRKKREYYKNFDFLIKKYDKIVNDAEIFTNF